jgi:hypothetical protein
MMSKAILAPAAVLVAWSLLVMTWMAFTRLGSMRELPREKLRELPRTGGRGQDLERVLPQEVNWVSHNYSHLMEQPTLFYAIVAVLAIAGEATPLNVALAWGYAGLRILHSLWQILVNAVRMRFMLFVAASACLIVLTINAVRATVF